MLRDQMSGHVSHDSSKSRHGLRILTIKTTVCDISLANPNLPTESKFIILQTMLDNLSSTSDVLITLNTPFRRHAIDDRHGNPRYQTLSHPDWVRITPSINLAVSSKTAIWVHKWCLDGCDVTCTPDLPDVEALYLTFIAKSCFSKSCLKCRTNLLPFPIADFYDCGKISIPLTHDITLSTSCDCPPSRLKNLRKVRVPVPSLPVPPTMPPLPILMALPLPALTTPIVDDDIDATTSSSKQLSRSQKRKAKKASKLQNNPSEPPADIAPLPLPPSPLPRTTIETVEELTSEPSSSNLEAPVLPLETTLVVLPTVIIMPPRHRRCRLHLSEVVAPQQKQYVASVTSDIPASCHQCRRCSKVRRRRYLFGIRANFALLTGSLEPASIAFSFERVPRDVH
ncbi:hypothetical protein F5887DRAFT_1208078 [Amanita rubescens]|nr:hypothetical protein F5887DRAFT_1208078 [Amanita rubescens]